MPQVTVRKFTFHTPGGVLTKPMDIPEAVRFFSITAEDLEELLDLSVTGTCRVNYAGEPTMLCTRVQ